MLSTIDEAVQLDFGLYSTNWINTMNCPYLPFERFLQFHNSQCSKKTLK